MCPWLFDAIDLGSIPPFAELFKKKKKFSKRCKRTRVDHIKKSKTHTSPTAPLELTKYQCQNANKAGYLHKVQIDTPYVLFHSKHNSYNTFKPSYFKTISELLPTFGWFFLYTLIDRCLVQSAVSNPKPMVLSQTIPTSSGLSDLTLCFLTCFLF